MAEQRFKALVLTGLLGAGILSLTNPGRDAYKRYAAAEINRWCNNPICDWGVSVWGDHVQRLIDQNTERYNLILFSIYRSQVIENDEFITLGILGNFVTVKTE